MTVSDRNMIEDRLWQRSATDWNENSRLQGNGEFTEEYVPHHIHQSLLKLYSFNY